MHNKRFGHPDGTGVEIGVETYADGSIGHSGLVFNIDDASNPEDMEEIAAWCTSAAARSLDGRLLS